MEAHWGESTRYGLLQRQVRTRLPLCHLIGTDTIRFCHHIALPFVMTVASILPLIALGVTHYCLA